jgi:uncharacterized protein (TIGR02246 family)
MLPDSPTASTEPSDLGRIEELFTAWIDALAEGKYDQVARLHAPCGVFQRPGGKGARGRDAIRRACSGWLSGAVPSLTLFETRLFEPAEVATANGRFTIEFPAGRRKSEQARGRLLLVAEKSDGRWGLRYSGLFSDAFLRELDARVT